VSGGTSIEDLDEEQKKTVLRYTYAMVYQIDVAVGRILGALENAGLREQTIVVFTSDHGDFLCDHGLLRKGEFASNALLHVPFVLSAPGTHLPPQVDTVMSNCDVMPTLAALAGVATPTWQHGQDICSAIRDGEERKAFAYCFKGVPERNNHTVYDSSHRFTYYPHSGYTELFDHGEDPGECRNVASDPSNRAMIDAMIQMLGQRTLEHSNPILGHVGVW